MAGLVPNESLVNGTMEVRNCDRIDGRKISSCFLQLQCLPLASLLLALGNPTVNYLSLDLEGAELEVLDVDDIFATSEYLAHSGHQNHTIRPAEHRDSICGI